MVVEEFVQIVRGIAVNALMDENSDSVLNSEGDGDPVEWMEDGWCGLASHQDPSGVVLNVLELLQALAMDPDEKHIAVVQPGGDKDVDEFLCFRKAEGGTEFGNIFEVEKWKLALMFDVVGEGPVSHRGW